MSSFVALEWADKLAKDYDEYVKERGWIGPDMVYKLLEPEIMPCQNLLDIGIGTGLSSIQFYKAGVKVYGIDGSQEMLKVCAKKNFTEELTLCDLLSMEFPFKQIKFNFIIAYGIFHIIGFIEPIFNEVILRLAENGIFVFSIVENDSFLTEKYEADKVDGVYVNKNNPSGILNYCHNDSYVRRLIKRAKLTLLLKKCILAFNDVEEKKQVRFSVYVCKYPAGII
jgi:predicted TPR repeat methyltransferase